MRVHRFFQVYALVILCLVSAAPAFAAPASFSPYCWGNSISAMRPLAAGCGFSNDNSGVAALLAYINTVPFKRFSDLHKVLPCLPNSNLYSQGRDTSRYVDYYRTLTATGGMFCEVAASKISVCPDSRIVFSHDASLCSCPSGSSEDGESGVCLVEGDGGSGDGDSGSLVFYSFLFLVGAVSACAFVMSFLFRW